MDRSMTIAVCGAGLGGLTAAVALGQRGFDVTVYEQAPHLAEVGAGLQLSANAVRVLDSLGLKERLMELSSLPEEKRVRMWNTGQSWKLFDLGAVSEEKYGQPYLMLHRADLHGALAEAFERVAPGRLRLGHRLVGFEEDNNGVTLRFVDGTTARADVLVGADGVHSVVRNQLFGAGEAEFSGCMAWRGVVPADRLPKHMRTPVGTNWVGPHGHVITYPLRHGELINFVGIVERGDWADESWTTPGATEECAADYTGWHDDVLTLIRMIDTPMKWALKLRPTLQSWSAGSVTLLGDACHATLPFLAQGAGMALEDGIVLARAMVANDDVVTAFKRYEEARIERTSAVVRGSAANAGRFHNPVLSDPALAIDYVESEWSKAKVADRYEWLFGYDALEVAV